MVERLIGPIPSKWDYLPLGEVCRRGGGEVQTGPFGSQLHAADYVAVGVPSIMPMNIGDNRIVEKGIARITEADAERLARYRVRPGDIVYSRRGDVERRALVREHESGWLCGTGCLRVRFGHGVVNPAYAAFYLGHPAVREWIVRHAHGATMPNLNTTILAECPFVLPPLDEQDDIAAALGALDDKIDLNRRMNETLEAMARTIFKDWFVDFGPTRAKMIGGAPYLAPEIWKPFPDQLDDAGMPKGWASEPVFAQALWVNGAAYKDMHFSLEPDALPVVKIAELKNGITKTTRFTNSDLGERYKIRSRELLFSWSGNPDTSIDTFVWTLGDAWLNQHIFAVRSNGKRSQPFLYAMLKCLRSEFAEIARNKQTTGLGHVTQQDLIRLQVAAPDESTSAAFDEIIRPIYSRLVNNLFENQTLVTTRDLLLLKLMSGEIGVSDAEKIAEAAQ